MARLSSAARVLRQEDELEVDYSERNGFLTGKAAAIADWSHRKEQKAFEKIVETLRVRKWRVDNPDKAHELGVRQARRRLEKRRLENIALVRGHVLTCARCGTQWCRIPNGRKTAGTTPRFCPNGCSRKAMNERAYADPARRRAAVERACAWQKANAEKKRIYNREWARSKRAAKVTTERRGEGT